MKIKKLKSCFSCWCRSTSKPTEDDFNIHNRNNGEEPEIDDSKHINYIEYLDPCFKINGEQHFTSKYELMKSNKNLVVRRGQEFQIRLTLKQPYDKDRDVITFLFKCRDRKSPNYSQGTLVGVNLTEQQEGVYSWSVVLGEASENSIMVNIRPGPTCIVGVWDIEIDTKTIGRHTFKWNSPIYIIFNPWCKNDEIYLESEEWREEAVLNSDGMLWRGSPNYPTLWKYAQFEQDILDCSMYLITNIGGLSGHLRSDPISVSRVLSAAVNINDDNGVVFGNWSDDYSGGKAPTDWTGSMDILQEYHKTKKPVRYGQCWVFAGVLTTVCRALGLPSRVVTNFSSAHDSNGSITVDYIVDKNGKVVNEYDSIWNFHVWSEVWMKRSDLGEAYDGWQVIDATPQEESYGMYRCGPASVMACKQGDVGKPFDVPFLFSEVNADIVYWQLDSYTETWKLLRKETRSIGKHISTKAAGTFARLDLTDDYKYTESSKEERAVYLKAMRLTDHEFSRRYFNETFDDIIFKFEYLDDIVIGQNFNVSLIMENRNSDVDHEISAVLRVDVVGYTGKFLDSVKSYSQTTSIGRSDSGKLQVSVTYEDYRNILEDNCVFVISCLAQVNGTNYQYFDRDDFRIKMPSVEIDMNTVTSIGKSTIGKVQVKNPLPTTLKKGKFLIEAPGLGQQLTIKVKKDIQPGQCAIEEFEFVPNEPGRQTIAAKFISKELRDVNGFYYFVVNE